jgi:shikimate kinase
LPGDAKENIALTGFMAVGKSAVGRRLARKLRRPFVDLDQSIEEAEGMSVREIFDGEGEAYFRKVEKQVVREVLGQDGQVIATGGGAIIDEENLDLLKKKSLLICLTASPETLLRRSGAGRDRPLLKGNKRLERIEELIRKRAKTYTQAHIIIDTSSLTVNEVVEEIIESMGNYQLREKGRVLSKEK